MDFRYPIWKCSSCGKLNKFLDTFLELCGECGKDYTLNWFLFVEDKTLKEELKRIYGGNLNAAPEDSSI